MEIVVVFGWESIAAVATGVGEGPGEVDVLNVLLEVALGRAGLVAEGAADQPAPLYQDVVVKTTRWRPNRSWNTERQV